MQENTIDKDLISQGITYIFNEIKVPLPVSVNIQTLNNSPYFQVDRISWSVDETKTESLIIKHSPWESLPISSNVDVDIALQYEISNYSFLEKLGNDFKEYPEVIKILPGVLVIKDLGHNQLFKNEETAQYETVTLLARLHASSLNKFNSYSSILKSNNLSKREDALLKYSRLDFKFSKGLEYLENLARIIAYDSKEWIQQANTAFNSIIRPQECFHCFIHNDFVSLRQSVNSNDQLTILDFEHADYGHALIDFLNLYVGKIEYNLKTGLWFRKSYKPIPDIFEAYKKEFNHLSNKKIDTNIWDNEILQVSSALSIMMVGSLISTQELIDKMEFGLKSKETVVVDLLDLIQTAQHFMSLNLTNNDLFIFFDAIETSLRNESLLSHQNEPRHKEVNQNIQPEGIEL